MDKWSPKQRVVPKWRWMACWWQSQRMRCQSAARGRDDSAAVSLFTTMREHQADPAKYGKRGITVSYVLLHILQNDLAHMRALMR